MYKTLEIKSSARHPLVKQQMIQMICYCAAIVAGLLPDSNCEGVTVSSVAVAGVS